VRSVPAVTAEVAECCRMCGLVEDAEAGRLPELQLRLEDGEDVNSLREGETALLVAATSGQLEVSPDAPFHLRVT